MRWVSWLMMHVPMVIGAFPLKAQKAEWVDNPDAVTAGSHIGMTIRTVTWRLSNQRARSLHQRLQQRGLDLRRRYHSG